MDRGGMQTPDILQTSATMQVAMVFLAIFSSSMAAQEMRSVTARDCVGVRDLQFDESSFRSTIKISPDGSRVAYLVRSPNIAKNENETELYVRSLSFDQHDSKDPILVGKLVAFRWLADSRHLSGLIKDNDRQALEEIDSRTGKRRVLAKTDADIVEYSINADDNVIVYAIHLPPAAQNTPFTAEQGAKGYRIPFHTTSDSSDARDREQLFVTRRTPGGWSSPKPITIMSPVTNQVLTTFVYGNAASLNPTLSPDGKQLLVTFMEFFGTDQVADEWRRSGYMQYLNTAGVAQLFHPIVVYDFATRKTRVPLKTPWVQYAPQWSADGNYFAVVASPPINSELERHNTESHLFGSGGAHLFRVEPGTGEIEDVASDLAFPWEGPLFWAPNGDLLARVRRMDTITRFSRKEGHWENVASWHIPVDLGEQIATDGKYLIGRLSDITTPPQLFFHRLGEKEIHVFAKLNPQFGNLTLAHPQEVHWKTSTGFDATGILLLPPDYVKGKLYPLVIHTKPFGSEFACSAGDFPSFAPQPIANAGIMYLGPGKLVPGGVSQREEDYYPKGYPGYQGVGGVAEGAFAMDLWDSAVETLGQQRLIDRGRVGIIGFSHTGWYTEFILSHSRLQYRAATVADNVQYSLGEYWLLHDSSTINSFDHLYGGPPYGSTLKNWLDYSISFNLDKIHTPLLMEEMGEGVLYSSAEAPPINLALSFEVFTGLSRLKKPVELYYYPNEDHTPEHPQARLATMQRNVDWYRFWLKDEEDPDPAKAEQYKRWHELRDLQQKDQQKFQAGATHPHG
jgi:dipeptidyl aminopeptidase/acylaminoacyl peptidase